MKKPLRYRGRKPIPVSSDTMAEILKTLARSGKQSDFMKKLDDAGESFDLRSRFVANKIKFDLSPKVINTIKDFCFVNRLHEGDQEHHRFVSEVIYSPPEGCPDYQDKDEV
ncbi:hypothetical protein [Methylobacterium planeticum]|uniref:Uncharacterized protein n=1 Tax=Methylobacterium planeticum TaxID=2615211 RepID=A0A6N6MD40_9HYPH|nr:hypothetical protein [Methylobacterium planeticum]KAB1068583.1 hypothetical protein F6X51_26665 [Methylobacterium planeticum]